jgi:hypothetical protein
MLETWGQLGQNTTLHPFTSRITGTQYRRNGVTIKTCSPSDSIHETRCLLRYFWFSKPVRSAKTTPLRAMSTRSCRANLISGPLRICQSPGMLR